MAFLGRVARHRPSLLLNHAADAAPLGGIRSFATHSSRASPLLRASATDTSTGALLHHPPAGATPASLRRAHATVAGAAASPAPLRRAYDTLAGATPYSAPLRRVTVPGALLRHHAGPGALLRRAPSFSTKTVFITEDAASLIEKEMARLEAVDLQKIPPHILHLLCRIEASEVGRHRDLADTVTRLTLTVTEKHGQACLKRSDAVNHIASVSWRVSTGVLAVTVGAAMGLLQVVKPQWEVEFLESACQFVSVKLKGMEGELRDFLHNGILQKKAIANAYTFLEEERQKDLALGLEKRESEVMARRKDFIRRKGAVLAEWDINLTKRESQSP